MHSFITSVALVLSAAATFLDADSNRSGVNLLSAMGDQTAGQLLVTKDWIAKTTDNICGLKDTNQVSNPAVIDFKACLDATAEMKKAKDEKIDLDTPEGIKLTTAATNRVNAACETVRVANSYCSVWKAIKHKDGRTISDITELVKAQL